MALRSPCSLARRHLIAAVATALLAACGGDAGPKGPPLPVGPVTPGGSGTPRAVTLASGLVNPWGLAFLPDGRALVTERPGRLRIVATDGTLSAPVAGVPAVHAAGQGGLLDVAVDPDFATTPWVYLSYAEDGAAGTSGTAVARGLLNGTTLGSVTVIFRQQPKIAGSDIHYGARLAFRNDKTLFVTLGERGTDDPAAPGVDNAQNLGKHLGKVVRINRDGSVPSDNPYVGIAGVMPEIWSFGHRNPQGAAINPVTGDLWLDEHGPQGGDEVNLVQPQHNYGWPLKSYGCPYGAPVGIGCAVGGGTHFPNYDEPLYKWVPVSTAPSGMMFYTGDKFPEWQNNVFVGALAGMALWRFPLIGNAVGAPEALFTDLAERIRDVRQGPDGFVYLLTDSASGRIVRIER